MHLRGYRVSDYHHYKVHVSLLAVVTLSVVYRVIADVSLYTIYTCTRTSVLFTLDSSFIALLFDVKLTEVIQLDEPGAAEMQTAVSTVLTTQEFRDPSPSLHSQRATL